MDELKKLELSLGERMKKIEEVRDSGAIVKNAEAMKETIQHWNKLYLDLDTRITAIDNNITVFMQTVKDIQDNNTLALQQLRGTGPTA